MLQKDHLVHYRFDFYELYPFCMVHHSFVGSISNSSVFDIGLSKVSLKEALIARRQPTTLNSKNPQNKSAETTSPSLNIRMTFKLSQGNVCARAVSKYSFYLKKFSYKITANDST